MQKNILFLFGLYTFCSSHVQGQQTDSARLVMTLKQLLGICRNIDFADPKTNSLGVFYKAAPYIVYRGEDKTRAWKDVANYEKAEEKKGVDEVCYRINNTINQDTAYAIKKYFTEKESEGVWHVLQVAYKRKGRDQQASFAFLLIKNKFILGDID